MHDGSSKITARGSGARTVPELQSEVERVPDGLRAGNGSDGVGGSPTLPTAGLGLDRGSSCCGLVGESESPKSGKHVITDPKVTSLTSVP